MQLPSDNLPQIQLPPFPLPTPTPAPAPAPSSLVLINFLWLLLSLSFPFVFVRHLASIVSTSRTACFGNGSFLDSFCSRVVVFVVNLDIDVGFAFAIGPFATNIANTFVTMASNTLDTSFQMLIQPQIVSSKDTSQDFDVPFVWLCSHLARCWWRLS